MAINTAWISNVVKGVANNHRVRILLALESRPGLTLSELAEILKISDRTASEHTKKLVSSGLISKRYESNFVAHSLTPLGKKLLGLLKKI